MGRSRESLAEAGRKGGAARAKQFTSASQKAARRKVSRESCAANGAKGARATIAKHGYEVLFQRARKHRLLNPSKPELIVIAILSTLKIKSEREYRLGSTFYTVDFYLPATKRAIEVNGRIHQVFEPEKRALREAKKKELLIEQDIELLEIDEADLADVPLLIERIKLFVFGCSNCNATDWIERGHPDDARPCSCAPAVEMVDIPY